VSDEADNVCVNTAMQEGHGTRCLQGSSTHVGPSEAVGGPKEDRDGSFEGTIRDIRRFDGLEPRTSKKDARGHASVGAP
jgi:hypothetical protein